MRRNGITRAIDIARSQFERGAEVVYLSVEEDGSVQITTDPPERSVFVAARSIDQVERFVSELYRRSA
jgi:hypothetical protein